MKLIKDYLKKILREYHYITKYLDYAYLSLLLLFFLIFIFQIIIYNKQVIKFESIGILLLAFCFLLSKIKELFKSVSNQRLDILDLICTLNHHEELRGVEVGVLSGDYSQIILDRIKHNNCKFNKLSLVDKWEEYIEITSNNFLGKAKKKTYDRFKNNKIIEILEMDSVVASKKFNDQSLNFVYIDANHSYDSVLEDLNCWWPKLKRHGILFGDDYFSKSKEKYGVIKAVNEFTYHNKIQVHFSNQFKQYFFIKT